MGGMPCVGINGLMIGGFFFILHGNSSVFSLSVITEVPTFQYFDP